MARIRERRLQGNRGFVSFVFFAIAIMAMAFLCGTVAIAEDASQLPPRGIPASTHPEIGPVGAPAGIKSPIEEMGFGDFKGVIHAHSFLSHDSEGSPSRIIQAAQAVGINFVLMTDHPSPYTVTHGLRGMHGGVLFIPGSEINVDTGGSLLGIGLEQNVDSGSLKDVIDAVHKQGGLAILSHVEGYKDWSATDWDGMEIYNTHYDALYDGSASRTYSLLRHLDKEPDRVWQSILDRPKVYLDDWDAQIKNRRAPGIAANDSHENVVLTGYQLDTYERSYGLVSTHLFLMELTREDVFRAIKAGHGYVCFDVFADCRGFYLTATNGKNIAIMGDEFILDPKTPSTLEAGLPAEARIRLYKDGALFKEETGKSIKIDLKEPGAYRIEAQLMRKKKFTQWIYSNPIYVK